LRSGFSALSGLAVVLAGLLAELAAPGVGHGEAAADGAVPTIRGRVLVVRDNSQEVAMDVGEAHGVKKGMVFRAFRGVQFVALLRVFHVTPDMSVAQVTQQALPVRPADQVTTRLLEADTSKSEPARPPPAADVPERDVTMPKARGRVLGVRQDVGLVALSLGAAQGLSAGDRLSVVRGDVWVAAVVVRTVEPKVSVARIEFQSGDIRVGDLALLRPAKAPEP
jgi:hypothetical protein